MMRKIFYVPIFISVMAAIILLYSSGGETTKSISLGIGSSLIASFVYAIFNYYFEEKLSATTSKLESAIAGLKVIGSDLINNHSKGLADVRNKYGEKPQFWFDILKESTSALDMMGNSLAERCDPSYILDFKTQISRILKSGGRVRIIIMNPLSDLASKKREIFGKNYKSACEKFLSLMNDIKHSPELRQHSDNLHCYLTSDYITYMMIKTDLKIYVSPYMSTKKSAAPFLAGFLSTSQFSSPYMADFEEMMTKSDPHKFAGPVRLSP
jgi:hypothetical protein